MKSAALAGLSAGFEDVAVVALHFLQPVFQVDWRDSARFWALGSPKLRGQEAASHFGDQLAHRIRPLGLMPIEPIGMGRPMTKLVQNRLVVLRCARTAHGKGTWM